MPEFKSLANKFLVVLPTVRLTEAIDNVIAQLEPFFEEAKFIARVTSGLRDPAGQLEIIRHLAREHRVDIEFPSIMTCGLLDKVMFGTGAVFAWQPAWSRLLTLQVIVNPPLTARVLFDYLDKGVNKLGWMISASPHFKGTAFDIGGGTGKPTVDDELAVIQKAWDSKAIVGWNSFRIERNNNCLHNDCQ
jgi:hypothetical protein